MSCSYPYDDAFFEGISGPSRESARVVVPLIQAEVPGCCVLDVGCGLGAWTVEFQALPGGERVVGVDGPHVDVSKVWIQPFIAHDLTTPLDLGQRFCRVLCLEVAEHLPAAAADTLIDSLTRHSDDIFFSAAVPGQGGHGHINEQPHDYWHRMFALRGYTMCNCIRPQIWGDERVCSWYANNLFHYWKRA
jgi:SAM-dependent methyltransferase